MKVLVTGNRGYIGSVLVPMLQSAGHRVIGLDADLYERCNYKPGGRLPSVETIRRDVRDARDIELEGYDAIIHLAALSNDPLSDLNPQITFEINHAASVALAVCAKNAGVRRFLYASSCSNYGKAGPELIDETGELKPVTPYGISKVLSERDIAQLADHNFCQYFCVRLPLTAYRLATDLTSFSTIWLRGLRRKDLSISSRMALLCAPSSTSKTCRGRSSPLWKHLTTSCATRRLT